MHTKIWNSKNIKCEKKNQSFYDKRVQTRTWFVSQWLSKNGRLLSYTEFLKTFGIPIPVQQYCMAVNAKPTRCLWLLLGSSVASKQPMWKADIMLNNIKIKKNNNKFKKKIAHKMKKFIYPMNHSLKSTALYESCIL